MSKIQLRFKDPDAISDLLEAAVPGRYGDPKVKSAREKLADKYFKFGDYGCFELDAKSWCGRLLPVKDWK